MFRHVINDGVAIPCNKRCMMSLSTDTFIEAFAAELVTRGHRVVHLNEPRVRLGLLEIYKFLDARIANTLDDLAHREERRYLIKLRALFAPSPIGAFDEFEHLMRAKQTYLTRHPNPVYDYIEIGMSVAAAQFARDSLEPTTASLVRDTVARLIASNEQAV